MRVALGKPAVNRACAHCGKTFPCQHRLKKYCSDKCILEAAGKRSLAYYYKNHNARKTKALKCPYCGAGFRSSYWNKIYCCPRHKTLAERKRKRTPESRKKRKKEYIKHTLNAVEKESNKRGWTAKDRKAYGSRYWLEVVKPRLKRQREAEAAAFALEGARIPTTKIQGLSPEQISKYWDRII